MSDKHLRGEPDVVLSTVRRVVTGPSTQDDASVDSEPAPERLLLTPALRVDDDDLGEIPQPTARRRTRVQTRTLTAERISLEQRIAELEQAVGNGDGWEPDGSEPEDAETPTQFVFDGPRQGYVPAPLPQEQQTTVTLVDENDLVRAQATSEVPVEPEPETVAEPTDLTADPRVLPEQPVTSLRPFPGAARDFRDQSEPRMSSPPEPDPEPDHEPETGFDLEDERVIDEEVLRDIVAEIVRSELQGELGERITRNVRKLVRREIHRAIMTRDFG